MSACRCRTRRLKVLSTTTGSGVLEFCSYGMFLSAVINASNPHPPASCRSRRSPCPANPSAGCCECPTGLRSYAVISNCRQLDSDSLDGFPPQLLSTSLITPPSRTQDSASFTSCSGILFGLRSTEMPLLAFRDLESPRALKRSSGSDPVFPAQACPRKRAHSTCGWCRTLIRLAIPPSATATCSAANGTPLWVAGFCWATTPRRGTCSRETETWRRPSVPRDGCSSWTPPTSRGRADRFRVHPRRGKPAGIHSTVRHQPRGARRRDRAVPARRLGGRTQAARADPKVQRGSGAVFLEVEGYGWLRRLGLRCQPLSRSRQVAAVL